MICILKFFSNTNRGKDNDNDVISRTMLKIAVVSRHYKKKYPGNLPKHGELWKCRILREKNPGKNTGCHIVEPIEQVDDKSILHLIPGWYDEKLINGRLIIIPRKPHINWILPLTHKRIAAEEHDAYCVIVRLDAIPLNPMPDSESLPLHGEELLGA